MPLTPAPIAWQLLTRLGELQILLPALLVAVWTIRRDAPRLALRWLLSVLAAIALTGASKIAFIGYGWGSPALDFTGVSGHAMMAASVLPLLLALAVPSRSERAGCVGFAVGFVVGALLALAIAASRVLLHAHSWSEVVAGVVLGCAVNVFVLAVGQAPRPRLRGALTLALLAALLLAALEAPPARTHSVVTRMALALSGRAQPHTRWQMQRQAAQERQRPVHRADR